MICTPLPVIGAAMNRIIANAWPELAALWSAIPGAIHTETLVWVIVDIGLLTLVIREWRSGQMPNVFSRVLVIFVILQLIAINWHRLPGLPALGNLLVGI